MKEIDELISEMMILERHLVQVGAVAVTTPYSFGRRVSGFGVSFVGGVAMFE